ncbi:uncharacterized protein LOC124177898 [Neodiprion fabricii]|uniref:uncharacterized protein LOC124177898 n=1 Tax=Neodiprion fabricii TaxID=2872261 RepID=UPI001ED931B8|nr:uncharacterized protein LOC124177898 [Neodiprion fabricii]XP_046416780.1 uncharacterized protein LOC124177898 [Neodiprion fabricii]
MLLRWKENLNVFNVFTVALVMRTEIVTGFIDYSEIRRNEHPIVLDPHLARTTRQLLEKYDSWAVYRTSYTLQQATEHFLHYGAFLRNQILDTFGALVYDHYDDFSTSQLEALYRVYRDTLKRKYNIFDIVPSVLAQSDIRPSSICRHINKNVRTCLRESSLRCATMKQHDKSHPHTILTRVFNITRYMFKTAGLKQQFPEGFSLPAILERLKSGHLSLTAGMVSGLLQSVQYDSFNDEVRAAEKNVMQLLMSEKLDSGRKQSLMPRDQLRQVLTVNELLKNIFEGRKSMYDRNENKNFDVLSQHVISEVEAISPNIEILGAVYVNNTIQMKYLFDLVLPPDVVDRDISDAKNYLLNKMQDFDVVRKYLKVEKYQQSGPDQLLMEILRQMRDINFAPDIVTALHTHARFWHQSRMINNLNDLLDLFDAYENLRNVPNFSNLVSLMDDIRGSLINSKVVAIELLCSNPRSCLQRGLKIIAQCTLVNSKTKSLLVRLFHNLNQDGSIDIDKCKRSTNQLITEVLKPSLQARSEKTGEVTSELTIQNDSNNMELSGAKNKNTADHETATEMITVENFVEKQLEVKLRASEEPTTITTTNTNSLEEDDSDKAYNRFFGHCLGMECSDYFSFDSSYLDYFSGDWLESSSSEEEQHHHEHKCIGKNCPPSWMPNKPQHCANGNCGIPSVPEHPIECIGSDCNDLIPPSVSYPECIGNRCDNKQECIGKNCPPSWMPNKPQHCANGNCGIPSVPEHPIECIGSDCNDLIPPSVSYPECIGNRCDNKQECIGKNCPPSWMPNKPQHCANGNCGIPSVPEHPIECIGSDCNDLIPPSVSYPECIGNRCDDKQECIGKNCPPSWMPNKPQHCANGNCGIPSVPEHSIECIGSDCNDFIPPSVSYPECIGNRCDDKQECIGKNCPPSWMPNKPQHCANGNCGIPSVPEHPIECIGSDCNYFPPTGPSPSECIFPNCNKPPLSNNLVCSGNKCKPSGEVNPWTLDESKLTMTVLPYNQCKFRDPQYQRRLDRLKKIRILDSFYATESVPTDAAASFYENYSDESHGQSAPPTKHWQSSYLVRSTQRKPPQNELLTHHKRPWPFTFYPFASHSGQVLKIKKPVTFNDSYTDSNMGSGIKSGISAIKNHTNKRRKMNVNVNVNVNRDSKNRQKRLRRHFISGSRGVVTSQTLGSEVKPLRNADYRSSAVDVRVGEHSGLSNPSTMYSDIKKKQANNQMRTNHVPHQTRSDGKIDVVRKRRSIITAPRRTNHRSGSL